MVVNNDSELPNAKADFSNRSSVAGQLGLGYRFVINPQSSLGVEIAYSDYGDANYVFISTTWVSVNAADLNIHQSSYDFLASYQFHFNSNWFAQLKVGAAYVTQTTDSANISFNAASGLSTPINSYSIYKTLPLSQITLGYQMSDHIQFGVTYQHLFGTSGKNLDASQLTEKNNKVYSNDALMAQFSYLF